VSTISWHTETRIFLLKNYKKKRKNILSKQILRKGAFIGANLEKSIGGQSKNLN
jgi:hypothetical protein